MLFELIYLGGVNICGNCSDEEVLAVRPNQVINNYVADDVIMELNIVDPEAQAAPCSRAIVSRV